MRMIVTPFAAALFFVASQPASAQANFALEIDGVPAGNFTTFNPREISVAKARRQVEQDNQDVANKYVPGLLWYPALASVDWTLELPLFYWMKNAMQGNTGQKHVGVFEKKKDSDIVTRETILEEVYLDTIVFPGGDRRPTKPQAPRLIQLGLRARGIVTKKPGGGSPPKPSVQKTWLPSNFRFRISDSTGDPVRVDAFYFSEIEISCQEDVDQDGTPETRLVGSKDIVVVVPGTAYRLIGPWFEETLLAAPWLDPIDDASKLKRRARIDYILSDGSIMSLDMKNVMILSVNPIGENFEITICPEWIELSAESVDYARTGG